MIKSKLLTDSAWKDVLAKNKGIKDNGLLKVLAEIKKLDDDDHDGAHKRLEEVQKLVTQLKKAKEVSAIQVVTKFLAELANATETAVRDVVKDKAEAQKTSKIALAAAEAKKKEDDDKKKGGDEEEEEESALLTTKLIPLLRSVKKGERMHTMVATSGKQAVVMLSRKPISASRRKILSDELGTSGGVKYAVGHCVSEHGVVSFVLSTEVAGMAKKLKLALFQQTGMRINKLSCRGEDGETDADEDEEDAPVVAEGDGDGDDDDDSDGDDGGDGDDDKGSASDGGAGGGADAKAASPELSKAPALWDGTRDLVQSRVDALKDEVRARVGDAGGPLVDQIDGQLEKLDRILGKLDQRLGKSLAVAGRTTDPAGRTAAIKQSKAILAEYIQYVRSEPLIDHLDKNPFGVKTELKTTLSKSLTQMAQALS